MGLSRGWTNTVDNGVANASWDAYVATIQTEVQVYNTRFAGSGYTAVDWKLCKAILWVESGGPTSPAWTKRVMQIGNPGDPAYGTLKGGGSTVSLIVSTSLASDLQHKSIDDPQLNIRAAIAFLFLRMAQFEDKSVIDPAETADHTYTVVPGDNLSAIGRKVGTTVEVLKAMNPGADKMIKPGQVLKYRKAAVRTVIVGWRAFNTANIAQRYNGNGDPNYAEKLNYVLDLFTKLKRP
jgi:LysM repeat protein